MAAPKRPLAFFRCKTTGFYKFRVAAPGHKRRIGVCTGKRTLREARALMAETKVEQLQQLAEAKAVTEETVRAVLGQGERTFSDVYDEFRVWLPTVTSGVSAEHNYILLVGDMLNFLRCRDLPLEKVNEARLSEWLHHRGCSASTMNVRLAAVRKFFGFAMAKGWARTDPARLIAVQYQKIPHDKLAPKAVVPAMEEDYVKSLAGLTGKWREWLILSWCCGLRMVDCIALEWAQFDGQRMTVFPRKSRRFLRKVELPLAHPLISRPELHELVADLLKRERLSPQFVYADDYNRRVAWGADYFSAFFAKSFKKAGVDDALTFHSFRRGFMVRLEGMGMPLEQIAQMAGHASTDTTKGYLATKFSLPAPTEPVDVAAMEMAASAGIS
jgi:integrase/recombinase XerC